jgi:SAM-dependent methyltransferase
MPIDIRFEAAKHYDSEPDFPKDIPFYRQQISSPDFSVLELGCGTGRVTLALLPQVHFIYGIDISPAMLAICLEKLAKAGIPSDKAKVAEGDITDFNLGRTFDLIIAPYRVLQNLETDREVNGLFRCIRRHLAPHGTCILNVFKTRFAPDALQERWAASAENFAWEVPVTGGRLVCLELRRGIDGEKLVLYPELIYRRYEGEIMMEESVLKIAMRCYYPDTFEKLIVDRGFTILNRWGGYEGEVYGEGSELVIQFGK